MIKLESFSYLHMSNHCSGLYNFLPKLLGTTDEGLKSHMWIWSHRLQTHKLANKKVPRKLSSWGKKTKNMQECAYFLDEIQDYFIFIYSIPANVSGP